VSFVFSSRRRHTSSKRDWSSDVCSSDLIDVFGTGDTLCYWRLCAASPQLLVHDVPNCGYHITFFHDGKDERLFYATDTATLDGVDRKSVVEGKTVKLCMPSSTYNRKNVN